jgi:hypothetical protein
MLPLAIATAVVATCTVPTFKLKNAAEHGMIVPAIGIGKCTHAVKLLLVCVLFSLIHVPVFRHLTRTLVT